MRPGFHQLKVGFVNLMYPHFEGSRQALAHANAACKFIGDDFGAEVIDYAKPVETRSQATEAWLLFKARDVDCVVMFNGTFTTGELTAEIIRNTDCPIAVWGIEEIALEKSAFTGSMVGVLAAGAIMKNLERRFGFIYGTIDLDDTKEQVRLYLRAIRAISYLREATIAVIGMRPDGFQISGYDELAIKDVFGSEMINVSLHAFRKMVDDVPEREVDQDMVAQQELFAIRDEDRSAARQLSKMYLALKKLAQEKNIQAYAPECWPEFKSIAQSPFCPANGRMNVEGVMASCECDVDGSVSLMLAYALTGTTPWFADFLNIIADRDAVLWWHCGNAPYNMSSKKPVIEEVLGSLSQTNTLREGPATVCRVNSIKGNFVIHAAVGDILNTKPLLKGSTALMCMRNGNTGFVDSMLHHGIPHHNAIVYGDIISELKLISQLLDIQLIIA